jgi:hypothetical protein
MKFLVAGLLLLSCVFSMEEEYYNGENLLEGMEDQMMYGEITEAEVQLSQMLAYYMFINSLEMIMGMGETIAIIPINDEEIAEIQALWDLEDDVNENVIEEEAEVKQEEITHEQIDNIEEQVGKNTRLLEILELQNQEAKLVEMEREIAELKDKIGTDGEGLRYLYGEYSDEDVEKLKELEEEKQKLEQKIEDLTMRRSLKNLFEDDESY